MRESDDMEKRATFAIRVAGGPLSEDLSNERSGWSLSRCVCVSSERCRSIDIRIRARFTNYNPFEAIHIFSLSSLQLFLEWLEPCPSGHADHFLLFIYAGCLVKFLLMLQMVKFCTVENLKGFLFSVQFLLFISLIITETRKKQTKKKGYAYCMCIKIKCYALVHWCKMSLLTTTPANISWNELS